MLLNLDLIVMCIAVSTPPPPPSPQKHPPSFLSSPPLNLQTVQAPFFKESPIYIGFFVNPISRSPKIRFFSEPQKY